MESSSADDYIERFVLELLRSGWMLSQLASDLLEALPPDAYPGEETASVVVEMLCGTISSALVAADRAEVRRAAELIEQARDRTLEHLRLARDLSRRIHGDDAAPGRTYG